jgi:F0F1-type ATP synthase assembly protein I
MLVIILVGVFAGLKLDEFLKWKFPVFTIVLSILSVVLAIYYAVKDFIKMK